ncbi:MAG: T9SS type A sorting domain-containing protein [Pedobacter sp.]|nr:MAG: T9SS type A sorting domain-containing protein [Pedobacter sp.]
MLKQVDFDGTSAEYGEKVAINYKLSDEVFTAYVNDNKLNIVVDSNEDVAAEIAVFDLKGAKLLNTSVRLKAGENKVAVDAGKLPNGVLVVHLKTATFNKVVKIVK